MLSCQGVLACGVGPDSYQPKGNIIFCVANAFHLLLVQPLSAAAVICPAWVQCQRNLLDNSNSLHEVNKIICSFC